MLAVPCPALDRTVLIWPSQILGAVNGVAGIDVTYRCHCGGLGRYRTGKAAQRPRLIAHRATAPDGGDGAATGRSAPDDGRGAAEPRFVHAS